MSVPHATDTAADFSLTPVGRVQSTLKERTGAPRQADEDAPPVDIVIDAAFAEAIDGLEAGQEVWILTWLHQSRRQTLKVRPRGRTEGPLFGVFATRSPDRPNPVGLHRTRLTAVEGLTLRIEALEAIDGTPVLDIKPVLEPAGCR